MAKIKYHYDPDTCRYERVRVTKWAVALDAILSLSVVLIAALGVALVYTTYFDSPQETNFRRDNEKLLFRYEILNKELSAIQEVLTGLQDRDDHVYRIIYEQDPIPQSIRNAGIGGSERYQELASKRFGTPRISTQHAVYL